MTREIKKKSIDLTDCTAITRHLTKIEHALIETWLSTNKVTVAVPYAYADGQTPYFKKGM